MGVVGPRFQSKKHETKPPLLAQAPCAQKVKIQQYTCYQGLFPTAAYSCNTTLSFGKTTGEACLCHWRLIWDRIRHGRGIH